MNSFRSWIWAREPRVAGALTAGVLVALALSDAGCGHRSKPAHTALLGGRATVFDDTREAFSLPAPILSEESRLAFFVGNSFFNQNWVSAPASVENRDGLGPLFNARSCSTCHFKDGRSRPPDPGGAMTTMLLRVSRPNLRGPNGAPAPDPVYGDQIQGAALPGVRPEADVIVDYTAIDGAFPDGERYQLRRPRYRLENLAYGPTTEGLAVSPRVAPAMIGLGLLEAIPESALLEHADPDDRDRDGISGRVNRVWDAAAKKTALGRFGWKAEQPNVLQQTAGAFHGDMGLSSSLFTSQNHTERQDACRGLPEGGTPEVDADVLAAITLYARTLGVPARRNLSDPRALRGQELFSTIGCAACHVDTFKTGASEPRELEGLEIHPYTDLLLHDLGPGLSDQRPSFEASGNEWRTPPLWGIGLVHKVNEHRFFLHDGRARDLREAVLWHGGEASAARTAFTQLPRAERDALIAFLESL